MNGVSLSANSNVTIYVKDKYGKIIRRSQIHNKATVALTEGLLRFLEGDFTPSKTSKGINRNYNADEAMSYLPAEIRFGNVGVELNHTSDPPVLLGVNSSGFKVPTFYETKLQQELQVTNPLYQDVWDSSRVSIESVDFAKYGDTNNSMGVLLHAYAPIGNLVGFKQTIDPSDPPTFVPYTDNIVGGSEAGWAYWNQSAGRRHQSEVNGEIVWSTPDGEWETLITEIGLYSNTGNLLARVLLDGEINLGSDPVTGEILSLSYTNPDYDCNPIIQSESSSVLIEWKVNLVSIGQNDRFVTLADQDSGAECSFYETAGGTVQFTKNATRAGVLELPAITFEPPQQGDIPEGWEDIDSGIVYPENTTITGITEPHSYVATWTTQSGIEEVIYGDILSESWGG